MPDFTYKIKIAGRTLKKKIEAPTKETAIKMVRGRTGVVMNSVKPAPKAITIPGLDKLLTPRITTKDITIFVRQFATMIDAGLPLVQCLEILGNQQDNPTFGALIKKLRSDVEEGATFADALRKHPKYFDNLFVNLVEAGETGGILDTILNRLAAYMEKNEDRLNWLPSSIKQSPDSKLAYFVGCTASYREKNIAIATAEILDSLEIEFRILTKEGCCGSPAYMTGQMEKAAELAEMNVNEFKENGIETLLLYDVILSLKY